MAALFLADSPIKRSLSVKETKDGVVKLPCSLATEIIHQYMIPYFEFRLATSAAGSRESEIRTDLDIGTLVVCYAGVGGS